MQSWRQDCKSSDAGRELMLTSRNFMIGIAIAQSAWLCSCSLNGSSLFPIRQGGKYGYISKSGKIAINPQFDNEGKFSEGPAPVKVGRGWGYIDPQGRLVINPQFDIADPFSDGLALIGTGYRYGYIDKSGKIVINAQFEGAGHFADGLAPVRTAGRW